MLCVIFSFFAFYLICLSYILLSYKFCHYLYFLPDRLEAKEEHAMLEVGKKTEGSFKEDSEEPVEEDKQDYSGLDGTGDSDDEPLVNILSL